MPLFQCVTKAVTKLDSLLGRWNVSIERLDAQAKYAKSAFTWHCQGGQFHREWCIAMHRTLRKFLNIYTGGYISITNTPISIKNDPHWLPLVNAKSFCLLLAWASNLSILTLGRCTLPTYLTTPLNTIFVSDICSGGSVAQCFPIKSADVILAPTCCPDATDGMSSRAGGHYYKNRLCCPRQSRQDCDSLMLQGTKWWKCTLGEFKFDLTSKNRRLEAAPHILIRQSMATNCSLQFM